MSYDRDNETDVLALCGASAAFHISPAPLAEAIAGVRVCRVDGELVVNPTYDQRQAADITLIVAGTAEAITMVEGGANEASEAEMLDALDMAQAEPSAKIIGCINELKRRGRSTRSIEVGELRPSLDADVVAQVMAGRPRRPDARGPRRFASKHARKRLRSRRPGTSGIIDVAGRGHRGRRRGGAPRPSDAKGAWDKMIKVTTCVATVIATRVSAWTAGSPDDIRNITVRGRRRARRAHGSAIFTRGETQAFVTIALGTERRRSAHRAADSGQGSSAGGCCTYNVPAVLHR